ncbi:MAG: sugar phosphate nucleotidyltransferase, partial [Candidatus Omnitrophica bacterium]|nr:sugar phosphate nucleotidyltransferase [Candidatus Omnitrophota bacterium]
ALILGDNIFYGHNLSLLLKDSIRDHQGATIFAYSVNNPQRYGVIVLDENSRPIRIEEKPKKPKSNWVVTGLYFYDSKVTDFAQQLKPSWRQELEITDINNLYLREGRLKVVFLGRGYAWLDMGTYESLIDASVFIKTIEERQGTIIGCIEEIAYRMGFIGKEQLNKLIEEDFNSPYVEYLRKILNE